MTSVATTDLPALVVIDRRRLPDRRLDWRGGRRDSDWVNRPADSLEIVTRAQRRTRLRRFLGMGNRAA